MTTRIGFSRSVDALLYRLRRRGKATKVTLASSAENAKNEEIVSEMSSETVDTLNDTSMELEEAPRNEEKALVGIVGSTVQEEVLMEVDSSKNVDSTPMKPVAQTLGSLESMIEDETHIQMDEVHGNVENAENKMKPMAENSGIVESMVVEEAQLEVEEFPGDMENSQMKSEPEVPGIKGGPVAVITNFTAVEKAPENVEESSDQISKVDKLSKLVKMVKLYPVFTVVSFFAVIIQYVFNALSSTGPDGKIFLNKTGDLSDKYYTEITPAGWTFSIWGFIYAFQASWVVFSLLNICRKGPDGRPAYTSPQYLPNSLFILNTVVSGLNIGWLISFDRQELELSAALLIAYALAQYAMMFVVYRELDRSSPKLVEQGRTLDIWLVRGLVLNGIGMQATWVTIASLLNIQMVMIYTGDKSVCAETAGTVVLSILIALILLFVITDIFLLDRYSRYVITPYIVLVVALAGSISKNWNSEKQNSIFTAVLLAICCLLLAVKLILTLYRHFTKPRFTTVYGKAVDEETRLEEKGKR